MTLALSYTHTWDGLRGSGDTRWCEIWIRSGVITALVLWTTKLVDRSTRRLVAR
jgi:hypothetical protein